MLLIGLAIHFLNFFFYVFFQLMIRAEKFPTVWSEVFSGCHSSFLFSLNKTTSPLPLLLPFHSSPSSSIFFFLSLSLFISARKIKFLISFCCLLCTYSKQTQNSTTHGAQQIRHHLAQKLQQDHAYFSLRLPRMGFDPSSSSSRPFLLPDCQICRVVRAEAAVSMVFEGGPCFRAPEGEIVQGSSL